MSDRRERDHKWFSNFDERTMTVTMRWEDEDGDRIPVKYEICGTCDGKGKHVNPSIDSHGLSAEDFAEDPDFAEDYFSGTYDVPCAECGGQRVALVVDEDRATPEQQKKVTDFFIEEAADRRTRMM